MQAGGEERRRAEILDKEECLRRAKVELNERKEFVMQWAWRGITIKRRLKETRRRKILRERERIMNKKIGRVIVRRSEISRKEILIRENWREEKQMKTENKM